MPEFPIPPEVVEAAKAIEAVATIIRGLLYNDDERPHVEIEAEATRFLSGTSRPSEHVDARVAVGLSRIGPTSGHVHRLSETDRLANDLCGDAFKVLRDLVDAHDAWQVGSYPSDGTPRGAAQAWFAEAQAVENVVERARSLVATGPSA